MFDLFLEFYVRAFAVLLPAVAVALTAFYAVQANLPRARVLGVSLVLGGLLAFWYAGASLMAEVGLLMPPPTLFDPPYVMMVLVGGATLLWALARLSETGRQISNAVGQETLIGFQTFRIMGAVFILGWLNGDIPWQFALPAGLGDIWAGIAGYRAMRAVNSGAPNAEKKVLWANVIGLADFVVAVVTGLVTSEGFLHLLAQDQPNIINAYPLGLFPGFIVPLFIAFHFVSLGRLRHSRRTALI